MNRFMEKVGVVGIAASAALFASGCGEQGGPEFEPGVEASVVGKDHDPARVILVPQVIGKVTIMQQVWIPESHNLIIRQCGHFEEAADTNPEGCFDFSLDVGRAAFNAYEVGDQYP